MLTESVKLKGRRPMAAIARLSLAEYDRMIQCGLFDGMNRCRIELIRGELRDMNPIGPSP